MEFLVSDFQSLWWKWLWPILELVIGFGLVVFIHELGHFIVAKAVGINVEQFALGFGPRLFGFKTRETDYRVNLVPMGGYVKMVGQEDFRPMEEQTEIDPRAFSSKPVSARLGVISAGVVMNVILACVLFVIIGLVGIRFPAPVAGGSLVGYPAYNAKIQWEVGGSPAPEALRENSSQPMDAHASSPNVTFGIQPGYRILKVNDKTITRFTQVPIIASLADRNERFRMTLERLVNGERQIGTTEVGLMPLGGHLAFGLLPALSTTLAGLGNYIASDPFEHGDQIVAINGHKIQHNWQIESIEQTLRGLPVTVTVLRGDKKLNVGIQPRLRIRTGVFFLKDGTAISGKIAGFSHDGRTVILNSSDNKEESLALADVIWPAKSELLDIVGLVPRLQVAGVIKGSPADMAGLKPGDIIEAYGGVASPTIKQFIDMSDQRGEKETEIIIARGGKRLPPMTIRPTRRRGRVVVGVLQGLDEMNPVIAYVRKGSPGAKAGLMSGDVFTRINRRQVDTWADLFNALKELEGENVTLGYRRGGLREETAEIGDLSGAIFNPKDYRYTLFPGPRGFSVLMGREVKKNPLAAIGWGARETWDFIAMTYATLASFFRGTVSYKEFSGPVGIGSIAIQAGREGIFSFVYFMAIISISLAVLNFLPIPVMDGGYAVFLLIEEIRGKPLPLKVQNGIVMIGWGFLLFVFFALTWNDLSKVLSNLW
jgi:regulator of sigma E protease